MSETKKQSKKLLALLLALSMVLGSSSIAFAAEAVPDAAVSSDALDVADTVTGGYELLDGEAVPEDQTEPVADDAQQTDEADAADDAEGLSADEVTEPDDEASPDGFSMPEGAVIINETNFPDHELREQIKEENVLFEVNREDIWLGVGTPLTISEYDGVYYIDPSEFESGGSPKEIFVKIGQRKDIKNLKGLELIPGIVGLDLGDGNGFSSLPSKMDVSKVEQLWVWGKEFTTLDTTGMPNLKSLRLREEAGVPSVDLSRNTKLKELQIEGSSISRVDLGNNTELEELSITDSPVKSIDIRNNTKLTMLNLWGCPVGTIDISENTLLENLVLNKTALTSLDIDNNPAIRVLQIGDTAITSLDVSHLSGLETLDVQGCSFTDGVITGLGNAKKLNNLDISRSNLKKVEMVSGNLISLTAKDCTALEKVDISVSGLGESDNWGAQYRLSGCTSLKDVRIKGQPVTSSGLIKYEYDLSGCTALENVDICVGDAYQGGMVQTESMVYDFRWVTQDFENKNFKIQDSLYGSNVITIKSSQGSWIAKKYTGGEISSLEPDGVYVNGSAIERVGNNNYLTAANGAEFQLIQSDRLNDSGLPKEDKIRYTLYQTDPNDPSQKIWLPHFAGTAVMSSDNEEVCKVEGDKLKMVGSGDATVTVSCRDYSSCSTTISVYVVEPAATAIKVSAAKTELYTRDPATGTKESSTTISAVVSPSTVDDPAVLWQMYRGTDMVATDDGITIYPQYKYTKVTNPDGMKSTATLKVKGAIPGSYTLQGVPAANEEIGYDPVSDAVDITIKDYAEQYFTLSNRASHITLGKVAADSKPSDYVTYIENGKNKGVLADAGGYRVFEGGDEYVTLTVNAPVGYVPVFSIYDEDNTPLNKLEGKPLGESFDDDERISIACGTKTKTGYPYTIRFKKSELTPYDAENCVRQTTYVVVDEKAYDGGLLLVKKGGDDITGIPEEDHFRVSLRTAGRYMPIVTVSGAGVGFNTVDNQTAEVTVKPEDGYWIESAEIDPGNLQPKAVKTAPGGFTYTLPKAENLERVLNVTAYPKIVASKLQMKVGSGDYANMDDCSVKDTMVKADATSSAYVYTGLTYRKALNTAAGVSYGFTVSMGNTPMTVTSVKIGDKDCTALFTNESGKLTFIPSSDGFKEYAGKTVKLDLTVKDASDNSYSIPGAYTVTFNKYLTGIGIPGAKNKSSIEGIPAWDLTQEAGTRKTYKLTGIPAGSNIDDLKAYVKTVMKDGGGVSNVTASLDTDAKTVTVEMNDKVLCDDSNKTILYLYYDNDSDDEIEGATDVSSSAFILRSSTPTIENKKITMKVVGATDATIDLKLGLPASVKKSFAARSREYVYPVRILPKDDRYKEAIYYIPVTGMSQTVRLKALKRSDGTFTDIGEGEKIELTVDALALLLANDYETNEEGFAEISYSTGTLGISKSASAVSSTKESAYPKTLKAKMVTSKIYVGQKYDDDIVLAVLTPDKNAGKIPDSGYTISDNSASAKDNKFRFDDKGTDALNPVVENGKVVIKKASLDTVRLAWESMSKPVTKHDRIVITAPGGAAKTVIKVDIINRGQTPSGGEGDMWLKDPYSDSQVIGLVKKPGKALKKKMTIQYGPSTKAKYNKFTWSVDPDSLDGISLSDISVTKSGVITVNKNYTFPAGRTRAYFEATAVSAYNDGIDLTALVTLIDESASQKKGIPVIVSPYIDGGYLKGFKVVAKNGDSATYSELAEDNPDGLFLALLRKGVPVKNIITTDMLYSDQQFAVTDSKKGKIFAFDYNQGIRQADGDYADLPEGILLPKLEFKGETAGKMKITAVTDGGEKSTMTLNLKAKTLPKSTVNEVHFFTIRANERLASNTKDYTPAAQGYATKKAEVNLGGTELPETFTVQIFKAETNPYKDSKTRQMKSREVTVSILEDYYNVRLTLPKKGSNVAKIECNEPAYGVYTVTPVDRTKPVTVILNKVTYTINP